MGCQMSWGGRFRPSSPSLPGAFSFSAVPRAHSTSTQNVPLVLESACYSTTATPAVGFRPPRHDPGLVCADSPRERGPVPEPACPCCARDDAEGEAPCAVVQGHLGCLQLCTESCPLLAPRQTLMFIFSFKTSLR